MDASAAPALARLVARATKDPDVLAVLLFGSRARGDASPNSDFDVCLVLCEAPRSDLDRAEKRLEYLAEGDLDVAVFQSLPLYIRSRVLKEGTVLYARDEDLPQPQARAVAPARVGRDQQPPGVGIDPAPIACHQWRMLATANAAVAWTRAAVYSNWALPSGCQVPSIVLRLACPNRRAPFFRASVLSAQLETASGVPHKHREAAGSFVDTACCVSAPRP